MLIAKEKRTGYWVLSIQVLGLNSQIKVQGRNKQERNVFVLKVNN